MKSKLRICTGIITATLILGSISACNKTVTTDNDTNAEAVESEHISSETIETSGNPLETYKEETDTRINLTDSLYSTYAPGLIKRSTNKDTPTETYYGLKWGMTEEQCREHLIKNYNIDGESFKAVDIPEEDKTFYSKVLEIEGLDPDGNHKDYVTQISFNGSDELSAVLLTSKVSKADIQQETSEQEDNEEKVFTSTMEAYTDLIKTALTDLQLRYEFAVGYDDYFNSEQGTTDTINKIQQGETNSILFLCGDQISEFKAYEDANFYYINILTEDNNYSKRFILDNTYTSLESETATSPDELSEETKERASQEIGNETVLGLNWSDTWEDFYNQLTESELDYEILPIKPSLTFTKKSDNKDTTENSEEKSIKEKYENIDQPENNDLGVYKPNQVLVHFRKDTDPKNNKPYEGLVGVKEDWDVNVVFSADNCLGFNAKLNNPTNSVEETTETIRTIIEYMDANYCKPIIKGDKTNEEILYMFLNDLAHKNTATLIYNKGNEITTVHCVKLALDKESTDGKKRFDSNLMNAYTDLLNIYEYNPADLKDTDIICGIGVTVNRVKTQKEPDKNTESMPQSSAEDTN